MKVTHRPVVLCPSLPHSQLGPGSTRQAKCGEPTPRGLLGSEGRNRHLQ